MNSTARSKASQHVKHTLLGSSTSKKKSKPTSFFSWWWLILPLILGILATVISVNSHIPNTWLTGWDTLHPEFNFPLNLYRVIFGVFRPDQGLGSVATHAHMVELPRILLLWLLSSFVPTHLLRYTYVGICLVLGPIGIFFFIRYLLAKTGFSKLIVNFAAFSAGLWYLFNIGTIQHFALPFEMFPTNYAANGWLFWLLWKYLETGKRKTLLFLAAVNFFASGMAYSFISWYVYFGGVLLVVFTTSLLKILFSQNKKAATTKSFSIQRSLIALLVIISANIYWLGPNLYFVATHSWHVPLAKNNRFISEEIYFHNKEYGTVLDTISMKNHLFSWSIRDGANFVPVFEEYSKYLDQGYGIIPFVLFTFIVIGVFFACKTSVQKENRKQAFWLIPMLLPLVASVVAFLSLNPPLSFIFDILREHSSIIKEGLRNPFIKFNLLLMVSYATFFGIGVAAAISYLRKALGEKQAVSFLVLLIVVFTTSLGYPFLEGKFVDTRMQQTIPGEYFEMFAWLQSKPVNERVLVLPAPHFWAWDYHTWGYQGAGFMWFGVPQPFFSRDSDRWNLYNEEAYREITTAITASDWETLYTLLEKYQVHHIIFDTTVATNGERQTVLFRDELKLLLSDTSLFSKTEFSNTLSIFSVNAATNKTESEKAIIAKPTQITPSFFWNFSDTAFKKYGNYITDLSNQSTNSFLARNILTDHDQINTDVVTISEDTIAVKTNTDKELSYSLLNQNEMRFNVLLKNNDQEQFLIFKPILPFTNQEADGFETAVPITVPDSDSSLFYISITNTIFKASSKITDVEQPLGSITFKLDQEQTVAVYPSQPATITNNLPKENNATFFNCSAGSTSEKNKVDYKANGVTITSASNNASCLQYPLSIADEDGTNIGKRLLFLDFTYNSKNPTLSNAELCLISEESDNCINKQTIFSPDETREVTEDVILAELSSFELNNTQLLLALTNQEGKTIDITYRTIDTGTTAPTFTDTFDVRLPNDYLQPSLTANDTVFLPLVDSRAKINIGSIQKVVNSCGSTSKASVSRENQTEDSTQYVSYTASYGQSCDSFSFDSLKHNSGYIVGVTSRNRSGITARFCLKNAVTSRCDVYQPLGSQTSFETEYFLLPPTGDGAGYTAHFTTIAPGKYPSVNDIASIEMIPIPYDLLYSFQEKDIEKADPDTRIITNNQSFEENFVGFWYKPLSLPVLFKNHILVNNWANGWQTSQQELDAMQKEDYQIAFFFLPDLLTPIGLTVFGLTLLVIGKPTKK